MDRKILFGIVVLAVVVGVYGMNTINAVSNSAPAPTEVIAGSFFKGADNAPVEIIEYSDFECPFCSRYYSETYKLIEEQYIATGKVKYVFRHFPLSFHKNARPAALASECAREQGKFWEFHDRLFESQELSSGVYQQTASQLGLNMEQFNSCMDSGKFNERIDNDFNQGKMDGVTGTPSFFINGKQVSGAQPFSVFQQAIESSL